MNFVDVRRTFCILFRRAHLTENHGFIEVNSQGRSIIPNIFAIGDVTGNPMLAHRATHQGKIVAEDNDDDTITAEEDDQSYTIERTYAYRPDLLAFDLYGSPRLWWVFAQRNPDEIEDPIYDFKPGVTIQLPKKENIGGA